MGFGVGSGPGREDNTCEGTVAGTVLSWDDRGEVRGDGVMFSLQSTVITLDSGLSEKGRYQV